MTKTTPGAESLRPGFFKLGSRGNTFLFMVAVSPISPSSFQASSKPYWSMCRQFATQAGRARVQAT